MSTQLEKFIRSHVGEPVTSRDLEPYGREQVFFNVRNPPPIIGASQEATPGAPIELPLHETPVGPAVVFYTSDADAKLSKPFAGVLLAEALEIAVAIKQAKAFVLQYSSGVALLIE